MIQQLSIRIEMYKIILQNNIQSSELKSIRHLAAIRDDIKIIPVKLEELHKIIFTIDEFTIPIGSVEFVQLYFKLTNIKQPKFTPYPYLPYKYYFRELKHRSIEEFIDLYNYPNLFVKPVDTKKFNGFVFMGQDYSYDEHDKEQLDIFNKLHKKTHIYISKKIDIKHEFRCYINNSNIISICQYDDGLDYILNENELSIVDDILQHIKYKTFALDIAILTSGELVVIELNDAWAIGKYSGISNNDYFDFLKTRWCEIINDKFN